MLPLINCKTWHSEWKRKCFSKNLCCDIPLSLNQLCCVAMDSASGGINVSMTRPGLCPLSTISNNVISLCSDLTAYRWTPLAHVTELSTSTHNIILFNIQAWRFHFNFLYLLYQYVWRRKNDILSTLHMIGDQMQSKNWVNNIKNINTDSLILWR